MPKKGYRHSEETRKKLRESHWTHGEKAEATRKKISAANLQAWEEGRNLGRTGQPHSEETRRRISEAKRTVDQTLGYNGYHKRVRVDRGTPSLCEHCGRDDDEVRYEWANLTGNFSDVYDYVRLCKPCHGVFDFQDSFMECQDCGSTKPRIRRKAWRDTTVISAKDVAEAMREVSW